LKDRFTIAIVALLFAVISASAAAQDNPAHVQESRAYHCLDVPFVGIYARTRDRGATPAIQLLLTDPLGRTAGEGSSGVRVPDSGYGEVVQVQSNPQHSKALGAEICNAKEGTYEIAVRENGSAPYVLDVSGRGKTVDGQSLLLHHTAKEGRTLYYRFTFHIKNRHVLLRWLDTQGHELMDGTLLEINDW